VNRKIYSITEYGLVDEWAEKWLALIELINNVTGTDQPPSVDDELDYQCLRFWFIDHQNQFVPLWLDFYKSHDWASPQSNSYEDEDFPQRYLENHFPYFYEPDNLYRLAQQLELQSGIDIWEPGEHVTAMVRPMYIRLGQLMIEFMDWIDERLDEII
jgi:hypothetical protein